MAEANYCENCGFPTFDELSEEHVRESAQNELTGFLDGCDVQSIPDSRNGEQEPPAEPYQWYLKEGLKKSLTDFAVLQRSDWFDKEPILGRFLEEEEVFEQHPPDETMEKFCSVAPNFGVSVRGVPTCGA